jgi:hypothetical protein
MSTPLADPSRLYFPFSSAEYAFFLVERVLLDRGKRVKQTRLYALHTHTERGAVAY